MCKNTMINHRNLVNKKRAREGLPPVEKGVKVPRGVEIFDFSRYYASLSASVVNTSVTVSATEAVRPT